jgi:hypothetical protein
MAFTLDSTIGELVDNPQAKAVLDQYVPGASTDPMIISVKDMSLKMFLSMPMAKQVGLTKDKVELVLAEINKKL